METSSETKMLSNEIEFEEHGCLMGTLVYRVEGEYLQFYLKTEYRGIVAYWNIRYSGELPDGEEALKILYENSKPSCCLKGCEKYVRYILECEASTDF